MSETRGLNYLRMRMKALGANKVQMYSSTVEMLVSIFADAEGMPNAQICWQELREEYVRKKSELDVKERNLLNFSQRLEDKKQQLIHEQEEHERKIEKLKEKCKQLEEELCQFETPVMRDKARMAKMYSSMITVSNAYQQTEYIKGLSAIMGECIEKKEDRE